MATISRTHEIDDVTPAELAGVFCGWFAEDQAEFFAEIWRIAKAWPGAGWCQQSCAINGKLSADGRDTIKTIAAHVLELA